MSAFEKSPQKSDLNPKFSSLLFWRLKNYTDFLPTTILTKVETKKRRQTLKRQQQGKPFCAQTYRGFGQPPLQHNRICTTGSVAGSAPMHKIKAADSKISQAEKFQSGEATGVHRKPGCTPGSAVRFRDAENEESQRPCSLNEDSNGAERKTLGHMRTGTNPARRTDRTSSFWPAAKKSVLGRSVQREKPKLKKIAAAPRTTASQRRQLDSRSKQVEQKRNAGSQKLLAWWTVLCEGKMKVAQESAASQKQIER
jgi:hypothetical protein